MGLPTKADYLSLDLDRAQMGKSDSLRYNVILHVVNEQYDRAAQDLQAFFNAESEFPNLKERIFRYVDHGVDLINGIRTKRNFPGFRNLPVSKQQELSDKFKQHFQELQSVLVQIEKVLVDERLDDIRSTVWLLRAVVFAVGMVFVTAVFNELSSGLIPTVGEVLDQGLSDFTSWLFRAIGS